MDEKKAKKILVVDDEESVITFLSTTLKRASYEVIATTRGKQAVPLARTHLPDVIILDMRIPDMGGEEIFRVLASDPLTKEIPIIYLTALVTEDEEKFVKSLTGRMRVLSKPTTTEKVLEAVERTLAS